VPADKAPDQGHSPAARFKTVLNPSAAMQHYVGLDVSVNETSVCIVDKTGKVIREVKVATEPVAILAVSQRSRLPLSALALKRDPYRSGCTAHWLKRVCR
jgi:hypothetical protein